MIQHHSPLSGIACAGNGLVATAGYDNQVILWDGSRKQGLARACHDHLVNHCAFSNDGRWLVTSSSDHSARLWSVPKLRLQSVLTGHADDVEMSAFSPDDQRIATASRDHYIRIFDRGGQLLVCAEGHEADVLSVTWTHDGSSIISAGDDGTVRRWCASTGALQDTQIYDGAETDTVVVDQNGAAYSGNDRGEIHYFHAGATCTCKAHEAGIKRLAIEPRARLLVSTSYDRSLKLWRIGTGGELELLKTTSAPAVIWARSAAFTPGGQIALGTFGSSYATYDPTRDRWNLDCVQDTGGFNAVALVGDEVYAIGDAGIVHRNGQAQHRLGSLCNFLLPWSGGLITGGHLGIIFDAIGGQALHQHHSPLNCGTALGANRVLVGSYTGEGLILSINADRGSPHVRTLPLHEQAVKGVAASGDYVFTVSAAGEAALWNRQDMSLITRLVHAHGKIANGVAALPGGHFASVSRDLKLRIWNGAQAEVFLSPHDHSIKCVCASRDGRWIVTGSYGGQVAFFEVKQRTWRCVLRPTMAGISCLAQCQGEDDFIASAYDGHLYSLSPSSEA